MFSFQQEITYNPHSVNAVDIMVAYVYDNGTTYQGLYLDKIVQNVPSSLLKTISCLL
jgi:hypothetical protein